MSFESWTQSGAEISLHGAFEAGRVEGEAQIAALQLERDTLREWLQKIASIHECDCECNDENCCARVGEPCPECYAKAALSTLASGEPARKP